MSLIVFHVGTELPQRRQSQYMGVTQTIDGDWKAEIGIGGNTFELGTYQVEEDAALVHDLEVHSRFGPNKPTNISTGKLAPDYLYFFSQVDDGSSYRPTITPPHA